MPPTSHFGSPDQVPYFFFSYAHTPALESGKASDANKWVAKLFDDLCNDLLALTALRNGSDAGFMDRHIQAGDLWPKQLANALASCRVFVPLYSPRYFTSEQCGKEWTAFSQRLVARTGDDGVPAAIVPALWSPMYGDDILPDCAQHIQFEHEDFGPQYRKEGFYGLMKRTSMRAAYQRATLALARRIIYVAQKLPLVAEVDPPDYASLTSAFHSEGLSHQMTSMPRMRVTVVAPDLAHLPADRSPDSYGAVPQEWTPYSDDTRPLAAHAASLALHSGFLPEVGSLADHAERFTDGRAPDVPGVMIIDPWSTRQPDSWRIVRQVGLRHERPMPVVPWNLDDQETAAAEGHLKRSIEDVLPEATSSVRHVRSLAEFNRDMPKIFANASQHFFRTARTYPPGGKSTKRPRLMKGESDDKDL